MCVSKQLAIEFDDFAVRFNQRIIERAGFTLPIHFASAFVQPAWPVITAENPNTITTMHWGFVPFWAKLPPKEFLARTQTYNAISEEAAVKPTFRNAMKNGRRCLIPVTGFFEHHHIGTGSKAIKTPYFIRVKSERIFCLGGLYENGTYTILTSPANPMIARIHNSKKRQVVIIPRALEDHWLVPSLTIEDTLRLCEPYPQDDMEAWPVSKRITQRGIDPNVPDITARVEYPELAAQLP